MKIKRCEKGHFYDNEKFAECPFCAEEKELGISEKDDDRPLERQITERMIIPEVPYISDRDQFDEPECINISGEQVIRPEAFKADIYRNSALVYMRGMVKVHKGENLVYILGERLSSDIRIKMNESAKSVRILRNVKAICSDRDYTKEQKDIDDKRKELLNTKKLLNIQLEQLSKLLDYNSLENISVESAINYVTNLQLEQLRLIMEDVAETDHKIEELDEAEKILNEGKKNAEKNVLCVIVDSSIDGEIPVELSYVDRFVRWKPYYEIHMDNDNAPLRFRLRATILRFDPCEEWKDIDVRLFSESTSLVTGLPSLQPRYIYYKDHKKSKGVILEDMAHAVPIYDELPYPAAPMPIEDRQTNKLERLFDDVRSVDVVSADFDSDVIARFELPGKWTFPEVTKGDTRFCEINIDIQEVNIPAEYIYYAIPKVSSDVFLTAQIDESYMGQLIGCNADVYVKDIMIGSCRLDVRPVAERYRLSLGKDEELYVSRRQIRNMHTSDRRKKNNQDISEFEIMVQNRKPHDVSIQILDQVPLSTDNRIRVNIEELSGGSYDDVTGEVKWDINVDTMTSSQIELKYMVSYMNI